MEAGSIMAHFAKVENGIVTDVLVVDDAQEHRGQEFLNEIGLEGTWIQTSYNNNIRKKFAGVGDEYLADEDAFRQASPLPSWVFNFEKWTWEPPTAKPDDGQNYAWDEESTSWIVDEPEKE